MQITPQLQPHIAQAIRTSMRIERYCTSPLPQVQAQAQALMAQHHIGIRPTHNAKLQRLAETGSTESAGTA